MKEPYVEYTVDNTSTSPLNRMYYVGSSAYYLGLPRIYVNSTDHSSSALADQINNKYLNFEKVEIFLLSGKTTDKLETTCDKIEKVRIYYPENTKYIKFTGTSLEDKYDYNVIQTINYINIARFTSLSYLCNNCEILTSANTSDWDTNNITDMSGMFYSCDNLMQLDVGNFNTANVFDMHDMFMNCASLTTLDVSNFNTGNVIDMSYMFASCESLTSLDVSNFDTRKVTDMNRMFYNCNKLTQLDVSNFNTEKVSGMTHMFSGCESLTSLDVSSFNTSAVDEMSYMFANCNSLTSLDVSNFNTSDVNYMTRMFHHCESLTSLDLSNFDTSHIIDMQQMFANCYALETIDIRKFSFKVQLSISAEESKMANIFYGCTSLREIRLDECDYTTIEHIINSEGFPVGDGVEIRKIYVKQDNATGLTEPDGWKFIDCETNEVIE
jgi:surface protein